MALSPGTILVVDDDSLNRLLLATSLEEQGYEIVAAENGIEALALLQERVFDTVLLDLIMPEMDGFQVLERLKSDSVLRHIPVIIISALEDLESVVRCIEMGATDYLPKPFDPVLLKARLNASLASKRMHDLELAYTLELRERNQELDAFAHTVAHDLKNPLGALMGYTEAVVEDHDSMSGEERLDFMKRALQCGSKMRNIIDELLLLAGVRKQDVELVPLDMAAIVRESCVRLGDMIEKSGADVIAAGTWPVALGYGPWIEEVWVNFLSNAIKYGGKPGRIHLGSNPEADGVLRFWVQDNGPGLTAEERARLFVPFTRLNQVQVKGHGLGLSIVRRIVEKLGGTVGVESEGRTGNGSLFYFTLPSKG